MKQLLRTICTAVFVCASALATTARAELQPYPLDTIDGKVFYRYTVPRSIGLYRVSVNFDVPQAEIIKWNPKLKERGLHYAEIIIIPVKESDLAVPDSIQNTENRTQTTDTDRTQTAVLTEDSVVVDSLAVQDSVVVQDSLTVDSLTVDSIALDSVAVVEKAMKIALLLPLQADSKQRDPSAERFWEFYEGVLLAFKDLDKSKQYELFVYDIGKTEDKIQQLVADSTFKDIDAIIGPVYPAQVNAIAPTALTDSILTIIPFTNNVKAIATNPFLMQFNPHAKGEAKAMAEYLEDIQDKVNCVFVEAKEADIPYAIRELRQECRNHGLSITRVTVHDIMTDAISKALKDSMENIIIFNTEKYNSLQLLMPHVLNGKAGKQITLFSQYSWQKEKIILPQIYTSVFATDVPADLTGYESQYSTFFQHEHTTDLPRFDLLGYDITRQLIAWLEGKEYHGLQSDMQFERVNENGGLVNTKIAIIRK